MTLISAVVISLEEGENLRLTIEQLCRTLPPESEILVVDDGSTDGSADFLEQPGSPAQLIRARGLGVAGARNCGAGAARGEVLLFVDAHMKLPDGWWQPLLAALENGAGAVSPSVCDVKQTHRKGFGLRITGPDLKSAWLPAGDNRPHPVPILPGCSIAIRRDVFQAADGFDSGMIRSQGIDNEFFLRLWLLDYECWVVPEVEVVHLFRDRHPYDLRWEMVLHNRLRLALVHLDQRRIACVVEALRAHSSFPRALALTADSDVLARRAAMASRRRRDADWFFRSFGPDW